MTSWVGFSAEFCLPIQKKESEKKKKERNREMLNSTLDEHRDHHLGKDCYSHIMISQLIP